MKLHIALELSVRVVELLVLLQEDLSDPIHYLHADVRWSDPTSMRLLVRDIPEIDPAMLPRLKRAMRIIARGTHEFDLRLKGTRFMPSEQTPRMIVADVEAGGRQAKQLHQQLNAAADSLGVPMEQRAYLASVLVGRVRSEDRAPDLRGVLSAFEATDYGTTRVRELVLYQSMPRGRTKVVDRFALGFGG